MITPEPRREFDWQLLGRMEATINALKENLDKHMCSEEKIWKDYKERLVPLEELYRNTMAYKWPVVVAFGTLATLVITSSWQLFVKIFRKAFTME